MFERPWRSWVLVFAAVLFLILPRAILAANFTASLDRDSISLGESASLNLTFEDGQPARMPTIPPVPNLRIGDANGDSSQTVIANGKVTYSRILSFQVTPAQVGKYVIPALSAEISGQTFTTQPLTLTVGKTATANSQTTFLKLVLPKNEAYLGEIIPLEIQLYFQFAQGGEPPHFQEAGFTLGKMMQTTQSSTALNGQRYNVVPFKTFVIPVRAGKIELGPATMPLRVPAPNAHRNIFGEIDSWQSVNAESQPETLNVLPLPKENVPPTFNGAVGTFTVAVSASPTNVAVGDPITVKVQITGTGALDGVTLPSQDGWQQFKLYPPTSEFQPNDQLGMSGTKTFSLTAVPQNLDIKELPPFSFSFFDPGQKIYRTITQPAIPIIVRPSAASLPPPALSANTPAENQSTNSDIAPIKVRLGDVGPVRPPLAVQPGFLAAQTIPVLVWLALLFQRRRKERLDKNPRLRRQLQVAQIIRHGLKQLREYAAANQSAEFFSTLFHLLQEQLGERLNLPASAITESIVEERLRPLRVDDNTLALVAELFHACNQAAIRNHFHCTSFSYVLLWLLRHKSLPAKIFAHPRFSGMMP